MNFNDFFKKLLVAYGVYMGIKFLLNGTNTNGSSETEQRLNSNLGDIDSWLKSVGFNGIEDVKNII